VNRYEAIQKDLEHKVKVLTAVNLVEDYEEMKKETSLAKKTTLVKAAFFSSAFKRTKTQNIKSARYDE